MKMEDGNLQMLLEDTKEDIKEDLNVLGMILTPILTTQDGGTIPTSSGPTMKTFRILLVGISNVLKGLHSKDHLFKGHTCLLHNRTQGIPIPIMIKRWRP
jgi:hypothetical protein